MIDPFLSARRKWTRAEHHRLLLEADFLRLRQFRGDSGALAFDYDESNDRLDHGMRVRTITVRVGADVPQLSDDFPLILGDSIHNYRNALDHAVWVLVRLFTNTLSERDARMVQFPIHNNAADFEAWKERRTPGVPDKPHRALLKRYQPYRTGEGPKAVRWLRRLSDHDKHRELIPAVIAPKGVLLAARALDPRMRIRGFTQLMTGPRAIQPGSPIAEIVIASPRIRGAQGQLAVDTQFTLQPLLRRRQHPGGLLSLISKTVREVIDELEALM